MNYYWKITHNCSFAKLIRLLVNNVVKLQSWKLSLNAILRNIRAFVCKHLIGAWGPPLEKAKNVAALQSGNWSASLMKSEILVGCLSTFSHKRATVVRVIQIERRRRKVLFRRDGACSRSIDKLILTSGKGVWKWARNYHSGDGIHDV